MTIQLSKIDSANRIFNIFENCKAAMEFENIFQWTENYPNLDIIINDINNNDLYELNRDGNLLGVICFNVNQDPQYKIIDWHDKNGHFLIIHRLAINPLVQNQGLAKVLMAFAEDFALKNNFTSIRFDVFSGNKKAIKLYEGRGYLKRGEIYFPGRNLPFFCYERMINKDINNLVY